MKQAFKKFMKGSSKQQKPLEPRDLKSINEEYTMFCGRLGQAQYKLEVVKADISVFINKIAELDQEAKARQEKDAALAKTTAPAASTEPAQQGAQNG